MAEQAAAEKEFREKLLRMVKKEVKQIMEEAVTRKFVHEESSSITSLCVSVDACLSHGLKRRALGLFKTNSTTALLQKVAKNFEPAAVIARMVAEIENADPNKRKSVLEQISETMSQLSAKINRFLMTNQWRSSSSSDSTSKLKTSQSQVKKHPTQYNTRFLWIRLALFEKQLAKIVDHLVQNSCRYYEKEALVADPVCGQILASLLVGPCALDYSKMKTQDHFWTDPPADELVQRHRLSSAHPLMNGPTTPPTARRPGLQYKRDSKISAGSSEEPYRATPLAARDYVESLHQNSKATLLYGKNNVHVQPRENLEALPGYLSLHQNPDSLMIKWTPNQLMNGCCGISEGSSDSTASQDKTTASQDKSIYWEYAMSFTVEEIVYLHCHQQADSGGTIVLVGQDGVQRPPIHFPKGGHLLAFLSCLENGLLPHGQLDPPLWSQRGKGKVFPKLRRKARGSFRKTKESEEETSIVEEEESSDYVFRIITSLKPDSISQEMMDPKMTQGLTSPWQMKDPVCYQKIKKHKFSSSSSNSTTSSKSIADETAPVLSVDSKLKVTRTDSLLAGQSIQLLCDTMKRQIISRAFYGWLAHCRHLQTVRTHLSGLVHQAIISSTEPSDASCGLTGELWTALHVAGCITNAMELYRLTYFGGVEHSIRRQVWPYLLGHYQFGSNQQEREEHDKNMQTMYETTMSEWLAVEAIVRQRDKETMAANIAKLSSESTNSEIPLVGPKDASLSNEVFEDSTDSFDHPEEDDIQELTEEEDEKDLDDEKQQVVSKDEEGTEEINLDENDKREVVDNRNIIVTNPSFDIVNGASPVNEDPEESNPRVEEEENSEEKEQIAKDELLPQDLLDSSQLSVGSRSSCMSPASSSGGVYTMELLDLFSLNLHRIDKDVQRCDRNFWYFTTENLEKLRNVMCTYVWEHLDIGYVQGMCDLVAPLLVIYDDEMLTYSCFCELMKRMAANFPHGGAMDAHFANMRSLIQILDSEMFELMHQNGDYTHFYFCYRWFLLDFKRELVYDDVFSVWETIWAAQHIASGHLVLFIALALVEYYRDIILENNMDFTDIIKFFNEMAERHNAKAVLKIARELVLQIQTLIDNK